MQVHSSPTACSADPSVSHAWQSSAWSCSAAARVPLRRRSARPPRSRGRASPRCAFLQDSVRRRRTTFVADLGQVIQSRWVNARTLAPQGNSLPVAEDEDVATKESQSLEPAPDFRLRERQGVRWQDEGLGVSELSTVSKFVLYDFSPQVNLAVDPVPVVSRVAEVVERFGSVDATGAILIWCVVNIVLCLATTNDSRGLASRRQRLA